MSDVTLQQAANTIRAKAKILLQAADGWPTPNRYTYAVASILAALKVLEDAATKADQNAATTVAAVLAVHAEATTALMRRFMDEWKDGRHTEITPEEIEQAIKDALPEAVRKGIPDPREYMEREAAAVARADALTQVIVSAFGKTTEPAVREILRPALSAAPEGDDDAD